MKTKYLVRFLARTAHFDTDLELVDVMSIASSKGILSANNPEKLFDTVDPSKHQRLSTRATTDHSRTLAFTHLKATIYSSYILKIYMKLLRVI